MGRRIEAIPTTAIDLLTRYHWPGNIRELQNVIERSVILSSNGTLRVDMPEAKDKAGTDLRPGRGSDVVEEAERQAILRALKESKGMVGGSHGAAACLGLKRTTLQSRMRKFNISRQYK